MRILLDEDVYAATGRFLAGLNHDVTSVRIEDLSPLEKTETKSQALDQMRCVVCDTLTRGI